MNLATVMGIVVAVAVYKTYKEVVVNKKGFIRTLRSPDETWRPLRLRDRVFVNMIRLDDRYTPNVNTEFYHDFEHAAEVRPRVVASIFNTDPMIKKKNETRVSIFFLKICIHDTQYWNFYLKYILIKKFSTRLPVQMFTVRLPAEAKNDDLDDTAQLDPNFRKRKSSGKNSTIRLEPLKLDAIAFEEVQREQKQTATNFMWKAKINLLKYLDSKMT
jgi:hypothetical protein